MAAFTMAIFVDLILTLLHNINIHKWLLLPTVTYYTHVQCLPCACVQYVVGVVGYCEVGK